MRKSVSCELGAIKLGKVVVSSGGYAAVVAASFDASEYTYRCLLLLWSLEDTASSNDLPILNVVYSNAQQL